MLRAGVVFLRKLTSYPLDVIGLILEASIYLSVEAIYPSGFKPGLMVSFHSAAAIITIHSNCGAIVQSTETACYNIAMSYANPTVGDFQQEKVCTKCLIVKDISEFYKRTATLYRSECKACWVLKATLYNKNNKQKHKDACTRWRYRNPTKEFEYHLKTRYGLTLQEREQLVLDQDSKCKLCGKAETENNLLHVDHDHQSGQIRGMLCFTCNRVLGVYESRILPKLNNILLYLGK